MEKSIEERANKFALEKHPYSPFYEEYTKIYIEIATEQRRIDFRKACLAFCKTRKCGVPFDTCSSLGTCEEYDSFNRELSKSLMEE